MIACGRCGCVNEEHDEFCQSCGGFLDAAGRIAVSDDAAVAAPATSAARVAAAPASSAAGPAEAELALLRATEFRIDAEAEAARTLEAARLAELVAEKARSLERAARRTVEESADLTSDTGSPRPPRETVVAPNVDHEAPPDDRDRRAAALLVGWDAPTLAPAEPPPAVPPPAETVPTETVPVAPSPAAPGSVPCGGCGRLNEGRRRFCSKCGTRLGGAQVDP